MRIRKNQDGYEFVNAVDEYTEKRMPKPSGRLLDGSRDHGYWAEYVGYGSVAGIPVKAVYLLDFGQKDIEEADDYDWDAALENGRIEIDIDKLSEDAYQILKTTVD